MAQAQGTDSSSKQLLTQVDTLPEVMQSPLINQLKAELVRMESSLKDLSGNLGVNHPAYKRFIRAAIPKPHRRRNRPCHQRHWHRRLSQPPRWPNPPTPSKSRRKVLSLRRQRDNINLLMRDVKPPSAPTTASASATNQIALEAQSAQTNVAVLTRPHRPLNTASPKW